MNILIIIEHKNGKMHRMSREAIVGAQKIGGQISALIIGKDHEEIVNELFASISSKNFVDVWMDLRICLYAQYILKNFNRVNENSLILGDEPCSGTEHISAISIVSSSIKLLCDKMSSFIFATHLHKLSEISLIKNLENLHMYHLKIKYDEVNDRLIYDRKLEVGFGNEEYGLEVA